MDDCAQHVADRERELEGQAHALMEQCRGRRIYQGDQRTRQRKANPWPYTPQRDERTLRRNSHTTRPRRAAAALAPVALIAMPISARRRARRRRSRRASRASRSLIARARLKATQLAFTGESREQLWELTPVVDRVFDHDRLKAPETAVHPLHRSPRGTLVIGEHESISEAALEVSWRLWLWRTPISAGRPLACQVRAAAA